MASKNSRMNRGLGGTKRFLDGREVIASKYIGHHNGHGSYVGGAFEWQGDLICDSSGKPLPYKAIGKLERT